MTNPHFNPDLDLVLERETTVAPELVWKAWTTPELLQQWFTPKPWTTPIVELDLKPGGRFRTVMRGPEGEEFDGTGCILEVVPNEKLVWTSVMGPEFRPALAPEGGFGFTATILISPTENGSRYVAHVMHTDPAGKTQHEEMGFHGGWGSAFDQLVELMASQG